MDPFRVSNFIIISLFNHTEVITLNIFLHRYRYMNIIVFCYSTLGECWVKFLQTISKTCIKEAQQMLSVWLRQELEKNVMLRVQSDREWNN